MKRSAFPFRIVGIHTLRRGTAYDPKGLPVDPPFGPRATDVSEFLERTQADVAIEITTLAPETGEPATSHIRAAFDLHMHVITANKGPIAHAYASLCEHARRVQVEFRFESTVMDGCPVFNNVRNNLPGLRVLGFTGALNSTSKLVVEAIENGLSMEEGVRRAQGMGIAEADAMHDIDGWDSAVKTAALANVLMHARTSPLAVKRTGLRTLSPDGIVMAARSGATTILVSSAHRLADDAVELSVRPEVIRRGELLASAQGTSNALLLHTDLMGTIGIVSIEPTVTQTAYGIFADLVDIARSL